MKLVVVSHKLCWPSAASPTGYATSGGFPFQVHALSELFDETALLVPVAPLARPAGELPLTGHQLTVRPLTPSTGSSVTRKLMLPWWVFRNSLSLVREIMHCGAVHAAIPGDVGTIGIFLAVVFRKPLFVRYCGNWAARRTAAERFWHWSMERLAGKRNVMYATGGGEAPPSSTADIRWIFSTSLRTSSFDAPPKSYRPGSAVRLVIICRQEWGKGTDQVMLAVPLLTEQFPQITLDVAGDGTALEAFRDIAREAGIAGRVTFHGNLTHADVLELLARSTLFCYPTASEGFPKVVVEALAAGTPVITTRVSVLPQLIGPGCGVLLDDADAESIARAVTTCLAPEQYSAMSAQAIATARQYSLERWRDTIGERLRAAWGPLSEKAV